MPRFLRAVLPYAAAIVGAVAIFGAGAYTAGWLTASVLNSRLGQRELSDLAQGHALLVALDAGKSDQARSLLISEEDIHLMTLDMLSPYFADDLARSTCRIMRAVAKQRSDNAAKYTATESLGDADAGQMVAASLKHPAACTRAAN